MTTWQTCPKTGEEFLRTDNIFWEETQLAQSQETDSFGRMVIKGRILLHGFLREDNVEEQDAGDEDKGGYVQWTGHFSSKTRKQIHF